MSNEGWNTKNHINRPEMPAFDEVMKKYEEGITRNLEKLAEIEIEKKIEQLNQCNSTGRKFRKMLGAKGFYYNCQMFYTSCVECETLCFISMCDKKK